MAIYSLCYLIFIKLDMNVKIDTLSVLSIWKIKEKSILCLILPMHGFSDLAWKEKKVRQNSLCLCKFWSVCPLTPQMTEWVEACTLIVTVCAWILSYVRPGAEWHREQVTSCQDSKLKFCFYQGPRKPEPHEVMALNHDLSHILRGEFRCPLQSANQTASCMLPASTLLHPGRFLHYVEAEWDLWDRIFIPFKSTSSPNLKFLGFSTKLIKAQLIFVDWISEWMNVAPGQTHSFHTLHNCTQYWPWRCEKQHSWRCKKMFLVYTAASWSLADLGTKRTLSVQRKEIYGVWES